MVVCSFGDDWQFGGSFHRIVGRHRQRYNRPWLGRFDHKLCSIGHADSKHADEDVFGNRDEHCVRREDKGVL